MKHVRLAIALLITMAVGWSLRPATAHDANAPVKPNQFNGIVPILNVKSVEKSIEYYTTVLGFEKHWDWPEGPNKTFASITNGKAEIFLCEGAQGSPGTWICYHLDDVDGLYKQYVERKADVFRAPKDEPWGMREMFVRDPDGHVLRIGQNIEEPTTKPAAKK
jgi:catechol 2,3-dioxygenase-like lactoylglutathione lyase family enzyme